MNDNTFTGRLLKRCTRPASPSDPQLWLVTPTDRRKKNQKISELDLRKVEDDDINSGTTKRKSGSSHGSKGSDDNNAKTSSSSIGSGSITSNKRRKYDDASDNGSGNSGKKVTFKDEKSKKKKLPANGARVGTRSTRNSGHELFDGSQQPLPRKKVTKKIKKNEYVTVVQMLTGTLYLYKGETRRAEFVRSKY